MADDKQGTGGRVGPFHLGASLDELGPGMGQLYEAWQADGFPVLLLMPGSAVDWQPERPWRIQLSFDPAWSAIALKVEQSPFSPDTSEMANILVLTTAAVTRVEDSPRIRSHLTRPVARPSAGPLHRLRGGSVSRWHVALAGLAVLALGSGVWLSSSRNSDPGAALRAQEMATLLIAAGEPDWVALEQKPPCLDEQAEYKGKCYLPLVRRERAFQAAHP